MEITKASFPFQLIIAFAVRMMDTSIANVRRGSFFLFIRIHFLQVVIRQTHLDWTAERAKSVYYSIVKFWISSSVVSSRCKGLVMRIK